MLVGGFPKSSKSLVRSHLNDKPFLDQAPGPTVPGLGTDLNKLAVKVNQHVV